MNEVFIVAATRTPFGKYGGALSQVRPDDLGAIPIKEILSRTNIDPSFVEDVFFGCANQAGEDNRNVARMCSLLAGLPQSVPATTINRLCGSSLDATIQAARAIATGDMNIAIAGGVESMTRAPYSVPKNVSGTAQFGNITAYDTALGWRYPNPRLEAMFPLESMGETAENVAEKWKISREDQDAFALRSHTLATRAREKGIYKEEICSVEITTKKGTTVVQHDEQPRADSSLEKLATLKPAFRKSGTVTAGNSSSLNDGASALMLASADAVKKNNLTPLARIVSSGVAGVDPRGMGIGPVPATKKALAKAKLSIKDIDVMELNEAFAAQSLACIHDLGIDSEKVNPNGGAIAIGHPLGASGGRLLTTLTYELRRRNARYGVATMCIGVGQGIAVVIERA